MITLDERLLKVLRAIADEPTKEESCWSCQCDYHDDVCVFCGGRWRKGGIKHLNDCLVLEAKGILHDHVCDE